VNDYTRSTIDLDAAAARIAAAGGPVLVLTHAKPDGDAFGSVVALVTAVRRGGGAAFGVLVPPVPAALAARPGAALVSVWHDGAGVAAWPVPPDDVALFVVVDTGAWSQVGPLRDVVEPRLDRTLVIDHHLSGDIAAADRLVDGAAAAACEVIAELIKRLPVGSDAHPDTGLAVDPLADPVIGEALFMGIASDTGWFRYSNVRPATLELAATLIRAGVDHADLYQRLERAERPEKLALLTRALQSLTYVAGGRAALMSLRPADFVQTGAAPEETEGLIDLPQRVAGVRVTVLLTESPVPVGEPPLTRMSFRSRHAADPADTVNVADLAAQLGGGGHARAAGAKAARPVDVVCDEVRRLLSASLGG